MIHQLILIVLTCFSSLKQPEEIPLFFPLLTEKMEIRRHDKWGSGLYGAVRDSGNRKHLGLDIKADGGAILVSPIAGDIKKSIIPYGEDDRFSGIMIEGKGPWEGYEVEIFYMDAYKILEVVPGEPIGIVQDLTGKFPGIQNHVHIEIRKDKRLLNPTKVFKAYF